MSDSEDTDHDQPHDDAIRALVIGAEPDAYIIPMIRKQPTI